MLRKLSIIALLFCSIVFPVYSQEKEEPRKGMEEFFPACDSVSAFLLDLAYSSKPVHVNRVHVKSGTLEMEFCKELSYYPFRGDDIQHIYDIVRENMPEKYSQYASRFTIMSNGRNLREYRSPYFEGDKSVTKEHSRTIGAKHDKMVRPLVTPLSRPYDITRGLSGRHIALWQSHGYYFENSLDRWEFQRGRIFGTVEDLYTQSYVLPFLLPMLENAGANVLLPRERDINSIEIIVDNDTPSSGYSESGKWRKAPNAGFADKKESYKQGENPFRMGSARIITASKTGTSSASWTPTFPLSREYAVYVSYQSLDSSCTQAVYEVRHSGGSSKFSVNQKMGGSTWIYLGTFPFESGVGHDQGVFLSSASPAKGAITADAVKFGGGMGNIRRSVCDSVRGSVSGHPRFTEAARYWLQWAGFNDSIYSPNKFKNDYRDDFQCRGHWVNILSDGSYLKPDRKGYRIPLDLSLAFHTDAGIRYGDSIVGTLAIYTQKVNGKEKFPYGESRNISRDYADIIQTQLVTDLRALYDSTWTRRCLWDKAYSECSLPEVPSMILELLSHQNFADMRLGLDPAFRFDVSRAIYKGMLKYLAYLNGFPYTIQPLPVKEFSATVCGSSARLDWKGTTDPLEPSADATSYLVRTRIDGGAFDNGFVTDKSFAEIPLKAGHIYSFSITALNDGGASFPSEILCAGIPEEDSNCRPALVVGNFDRIAAPASFASSDSLYAGFLTRKDGGVPYLRDISYTGEQYEFRRNIPWMDDDNPGFGASACDCETRVIAGNTFDYTYTHGCELLKAGYSVSSVSRASILATGADFKPYSVVDIICGKEVTTQVGRRGGCELRYQVFPSALRSAISSYTAAGGNLLISGAYIASDAWDTIYDCGTDSTYIKSEVLPTREFITSVLKYKWMTTQASGKGRVVSVRNRFGFPAGETYRFNNQLSPDIYCVESPDCLVPSCGDSKTILRYSDNNISAGVFYNGKYKVVAIGFPLETITSNGQRTRLFGDLLKLFE